MVFVTAGNNWIIFLGRSTITIVSFAPYSWFQEWVNKPVKKRGQEYDSLKNALGQQLVDQVVHLYPQLKVGKTIP